MPEPPSLVVERERDGAGEIGSRVAHRRRRRRVVDAHRDRRGGEGVAGVVGGDDAEVVLAVGLSRGVPARGLVRPGTRADRRALELDSRDSRSTRIGGVARQADRAADVGAVGRSGDRAGRVGVVDAHGDRRGGVGVAGVVGGEDAEVVLAVGLQGRVPARGLVRPGAGADRRALEGDGVDAGAAGVGGVAGQRDRVADVGRVGRSGDRAGRVGVVDADGDRRRGGGVAGEVGGDDAEVVLAVGLQGGVPAGGLVRPGAGAGGGALEL